MSETKNINLLKATGIVRRIDELGRIVIPKEIRAHAPPAGGRSGGNLHGRKRRNHFA